MTKYGNYYHCSICGHVVSIVYEGAPTLTCCGQKMALLEAKTQDTGMEKHVPVIVPDGENTIIKLGSVPHPMTEDHHIAFIEVITKDGKQGRTKLDSKGEPQATFNLKAEDIMKVYAYCNLHGLWSVEV